MWLMQIFDVEPDLLQTVEAALRDIDGIAIATAMRDQHAYIVVEAPDQSDAMLVQNAVAFIDPTAIVIHTSEGTDASPKSVGL